MLGKNNLSMEYTGLARRITGVEKADEGEMERRLVSEYSICQQLLCSGNEPVLCSSSILAREVCSEQDSLRWSSSDVLLLFFRVSNSTKSTIVPSHIRLSPFHHARRPTMMQKSGSTMNTTFREAISCKLLTFPRGSSLLGRLDVELQA